MGFLNKANLKKTLYYIKRNGLQAAWYAVRERVQERKTSPYQFIPVSKEQLQEQRKRAGQYQTTFSIVVPTYRTGEKYLREMITSVIEQTYPHWQLVLADATEDDSVEVAVKNLRKQSGLLEDKIAYVHLSENKGIAENTNQALFYATGEYVGLLDHDDVLTPDALFEMAVRIEERKQEGIELQMLYSDEDKCDGEMTCFYEPNRKEDFNLDLLLSNNYICHFLVMKSELIKDLGFRSAYDGAQDFDLVLRAAERLQSDEKRIAHIPRVLYHWRCHSNSTAENPQSKQYAYDAGMRAVQSFADYMKYEATVENTRHLGFYHLHYKKNPLNSREDLGAIGGKLVVKKKTIGGRMDRRGQVFYEGLPIAYSGYLHRAVLQQDAEVLDIRCMQVREDCKEIVEKITGVPYKTVEGTQWFDVSVLPNHTDYKELSIQISAAITAKGYRLLYMPEYSKIWKVCQKVK